MATPTVASAVHPKQPETLYESCLRVISRHEAMSILERAYREVLREHAPEYITTDVKAVLAAETLHNAWKFLHPERENQ